jgi:hypothetical protein
MFSSIYITPTAQNVLLHFHVGFSFLISKTVTSLQEWKKLHMKDFLTMTNGFMHGLEQPEAKTRVETYQTFMQQQEHPTSETQVEG